VGDQGVGSWPWRRARMVPDAIALRQGDVALTYAQLAGRVDALAAGLASMGVRKGDRVAYLGPNDIATFETFFGTGRLGAIFVPLNTRLAATEIAGMLADCGARVLVHGREAAALVTQADPLACGVSTVLGVGGPESNFEKLISENSSATLPETSVSLDDPALILYTSGTTGRPKGAVLTHGNLTFNTMNQLAHVDVLGTDVVLCTAPLFHAVGLGQVTLPTLFKGGTVVMAPKFDPASMLAAIRDLRITAFSAVPTMMQMLCDHRDWAAADLSSLRYVIYGGSPVLERVATQWLDRGVDVLQGYGMTEAAPGVFLSLPEGSARRPTSAGVPHFFADVALLGIDGTVAGPPGTGELLVKGPNVFAGYWQRPQDTADTMIEGWFRTGDLGRVDDDGWAYIIDRVKDVIISGGENIYPAEVEAVLAQLTQVAECAVVSVPDERWGEVGLAYVATHADSPLDETTVRAHLEKRLAKYKVPHYIRFVDTLPRTATGKLLKAKLRADFTETPKTTATHTAASEPR
jgi:fatty-acyl-CoA synthase